MEFEIFDVLNILLILYILFFTFKNNKNLSNFTMVKKNNKKPEVIDNSEKLLNSNGSYTYTADSNYIGEQQISITVPKYGIDVSSNNSFIRKDFSEIDNFSDNTISIFEYSSPDPIQYDSPTFPFFER